MIRGIIDFHSHILPDIDDGSRSVEESIKLLQMESKQGISHVIATPHFYPQHDNPESFLRRRRNAEMILREAMAEYENMPQLDVGAEVYYFTGISDSHVLSQLTIAGRNSILIEMPGAKWTDAMYRDLEGIYTKQGLIPIVAHVERYLTIWNSESVCKRLAELPVLVQSNASFFQHRSTVSKALKMLKKDRIHLLGSDCHNLIDRKPNLGETVELIGEELGNECLRRVISYQQMALE